MRLANKRIRTPFEKKSMAISLISRWLRVTLSSMVATILFSQTVLAEQLHPLGWEMATVTDPISADRPGFSTGPRTVARGHLQLETGYQFTSDNDGADIKDHTLPLLLFRAGLLDNLELRIGWNGVSWTRVNGDSERNTSDVSVGVKI